MDNVGDFLFYTSNIIMLPVVLSPVVNSFGRALKTKDNVNINDYDYSPKIQNQIFFGRLFYPLVLLVIYMLGITMLFDIFFIIGIVIVYHNNLNTNLFENIFLFFISYMSYVSFFKLVVYGNGLGLEQTFVSLFFVSGFIIYTRYLYKRYKKAKEGAL